VLEFLHQCGVDVQSDHVLVAVSGGMDSILLHDLLSSHLPGRAHIAHVNYEKREGESRLDEQLVRERAVAQKCTFHLKKWSDWSADDQRGNFQDRARNTRYDWMRTLCEENDYRGIYVGHHLDDQLETFLIALSRGAGVTGLRAMSPVRDLIHRPLLSYSRDHINSAVTTRGLSYRHDQSNDTQDYLRNRVRGELVPVMKSLFPDILSQLEYSIDSLRSHKKIWEEVRGPEVIPPYTPQSEADYMRLYYSLQRSGISREQWRDMRYHLATEAGTRTFHLGDGKTVTTSRGTVYDDSKNDHKMHVDSLHIYPGMYTIGEYKLSISVLDRPIEIAPHQIIIPIRYRESQVTIRSVREGDSFLPFGMKGRKKVSDYMIDEKYSPVQKTNQLLLIDHRDDLLWVIGRRASELTRVGHDQPCLLLTWSEA